MELVLKIIEKLNLKVKTISGPYRGYRNSNYKLVTQSEILNLVIFNNEIGSIETIQIQNKACSELAKLNLSFQIRYPKSRIIQIINNINKKNKFETLACLYNYIEGQTISWESYTSSRLKQIGKCLAELHLGFEALNFDRKLFSKLPSQKQICLDQTIEMKSYFARLEVKLAIYKKLGIVLNVNFDKLKSLISNIESENQILHMDFVRGNIIWDEDQNRIVGTIDFEKMSLGKVEFDIARTLAFLIIDSKYKLEHEVREKFLASYGNSFDMNLVEKLVMFYLIYDFYKFLKHNPYESLNENEHFVRTRDLLLKKFLLKYLNDIE